MGKLLSLWEFDNKCKTRKKRQELHQLLTAVMDKNGTMPDGLMWPKISGGEIGEE